MPMTLDRVAMFVTGLANVTVGTRWNNRTWSVADHGFAWHRPFSKADIARFHPEPVPSGDILAIIVEDLDAKDAVLAMDLPGFFTIPHFDNYAAVLVELRKCRAKDVRTALRVAHELASAKPMKKPRKRA